MRSLLEFATGNYLYSVLGPTPYEVMGVQSIQILQAELAGARSRTSVELKPWHLRTSIT
jgi:hypothetical protein